MVTDRAKLRRLRIPARAIERRGQESKPKCGSIHTPHMGPRCCNCTSKATCATKRCLRQKDGRQCRRGDWHAACCNLPETILCLNAAPHYTPSLLRHWNRQQSWCQRKSHHNRGFFCWSNNLVAPKRVSHLIQSLRKRPRPRQNWMIRRKSYPSETLLIKSPPIRIGNSWEFMETTGTKMMACISTEELKMTKFGRQDGRNWSHCRQSDTIYLLEGTLDGNLSRSWWMNLKEYVKGNGTAIELLCSRWSFSNGPKM
jgi:hypothetical protein